MLQKAPRNKHAVQFMAPDIGVEGYQLAVYSESTWQVDESVLSKLVISLTIL